MINAGSVVAFMELDTSKFSRGISLAGSQLKDAASNFKKAFDVSSGADMSQRFNQAGLGMKNLGTSLTTTGKSITQNISMPLAAAGMAATKLASDFETGMAKIKTIADTSKVSLGELADGAKKISMDTGQTTGDVQEAMYDALSSGVATDKVNDFVTTASKAAIGGFTTTQVAVDGLTTTLNAYGKSAEDANKLANQMMITQNLGKTTFGELSSYIGNIAATSAAAGLSTEELFSSLGVLTANGIKTSEAITGMKAALSNIVKPSSEAAEAANALGLKFNVAEMKTKGWMPFLDEVRNKLEQAAPAYLKATDRVSELEAKIKAAQNSKTANATKFKAEIEAENKAIDELQKRKEKASNSVEKKQIEQEIAAHKEKIKVLRSSKSQAKDAYTTEQVAAWKKELKAALKDQEALKGASQDKLMGFATLFGSVEGLNSVLALTSKSGKDLYKNSMGQMSSGKDYLTEAYNTMMGTSGQKMKQAIAAITIAGIELGGAFAPYVSKASEKIVALVKAFEALPQPVKNAIGNSLALAAALGPVLMVTGKLIGSTQILFSVLSKGSKVPATLISAFSKIPGAFTSVIGIFSKAPGALSKAIGGFAKIPGVIAKVTGAFSKLGSAAKIFTALPGMINLPVLASLGIIGLLALGVYEIFKHWDKIGPYFKDIGSKIKESFNNVRNYLSQFQFMQDWAAFGEHILNGLHNGLEKGKAKVANFFSSLGDSIKTNFKKVLGIRSPSRVFMEFGQFIGQGLLGGMSSMEKSLMQQSDRYSQIIAPKISPVEIPKVAMGNINSKNLLSRLKEAVLHFSPVVHLYVTVPDTGKEGTKKLTNEIKSMTQTSLKDGLIGLFMDDVVRD